MVKMVNEMNEVKDVKEVKEVKEEAMAVLLEDHQKLKSVYHPTTLDIF